LTRGVKKQKEDVSPTSIWKFKDLQTKWDPMGHGIRIQIFSMGYKRNSTP
jgi:hypothetical protein